MNGTQQIQRRTAVRDLQSQINDLVAVVAAMDEAFVVFSKETRIRLDRQAVALAEMKADRDHRLAAWEELSFIGRLRWLLTGTTR